MATSYPQTDNKPLFPRGLSLNARAILLGLLSVLLFGLDQYSDQLQPIRRVLNTATYPVDVLAALPSTTFRWAAGGLISRSKLQAENEQLRKTQLLQNARLQRMDALDEENRRLRGLLKSSSRIQSDVLAAEIVAVDMDPYSHTVTLNKGLLHKVYDGQPLLDAHGVMGQVDATAALSSTAVLITDANHAIPVTVNRSGLRTVAYGTGKTDELLLPYVPNHADIEINDLLVTSGLGGRFPAGYPVAVINSIKRDYGQPFSTIIAKPAADITQTRHTLLVWHKELNPAASEQAAAPAEEPTEKQQEKQQEEPADIPPNDNPAVLSQP